MEGVVLVEMASGALYYTKSFSSSFDVRHPKTERLNFGALLFALQNFASSSIRSKHNNVDSTNEERTGCGAEISMFATPMENMVLATTPSAKLLVVLFTSPQFEIDVAKWLVGRVALNYENCDSIEMQLMMLNEVPRRFRLAFSQAVDETIERELIRLSKSVLLSPEPMDDDPAGMPNDEELFLCFYYSTRLNDSTNIYSDNEAEKRGGVAGAMNPDDRHEECRSAVRTTNPTLSEISRRSSQNASLRNMLSSTRAIIASPVKSDKNKKKKPRHKTRWNLKNSTVRPHTEPHAFQRVIEVHSRKRRAVSMEPHRTERAYGIADVLLPFLELSGLSLFATDSAVSASNKVTLQRPQKLDQLVWKNVPGASQSKPQSGTNIVAWRCGPCCIFYPMTAESKDPDDKPRIRLEVTALFDVLGPLLDAKVTILV